MTIPRKVFSLLCLLVLFGCAKEVHYHGFNFEHSGLEVIKVGETSQNEVLRELGSPTSQSNFGEKKFYYISRKVERVAFLEPKVLEQKVLVLGFDKKNVIKDITQFTLDDANQVIFAEGRTEIKGNDLTIMQQIMTNIGKYNKKK